MSTYSLTGVLLISALLPATSFAKRGDSDKHICGEIREAAAENCKDELRSQYKSCYRAEVDRMVDENNEETADLSGGGELSCAY